MGTTFTITLPSTTHELPSQSKDKSTNQKAKQVLLVDRELPIRATMEKIIKNYGFRVESYDQMADVIRHLQQSHTDFLFINPAIDQQTMKQLADLATREQLPHDLKIVLIKDDNDVDDLSIPSPLNSMIHGDLKMPFSPKTLYHLLGAAQLSESSALK